jgi:60 kDa SS-A/Ro ribonucleoprotein
MSSYSEILVGQKVSKTVTPQTKAIPGRESEMTANNAGGVVFALDAWASLDRFLILGSDKPSYYVSAQKMTKEASQNVLNCIKLDGVKTVARIAEISLNGRAPKNDASVFALALCAIHGDPVTVAAAYEALRSVARTGTHLFQFVSALNDMGKWNAAAKRGIAQWYTARSEDKLAVQLLKYQSRDGWAHRDVLRLAHAKPLNEVQSSLFRYVTKGAEAMEAGVKVPQLLIDFEILKRGVDAKTAIKLIESNRDITWEMLPTELHRNKDVMAALIPNMGITALIRKLGQLTNLGVIAPMGNDLKTVLAKLTDRDGIKSGRVHPITLLNASRQYGKGAGDKGSLVWKPVTQITDALDAAMYDAFDFIPSTGEGYMLGLDISGSMFGGSVIGCPGLYPAEVSAVMALAVAKRENNYQMFGFDREPKPLSLSPNMRVSDVLKAMKDLHWSAGSTDCSMPMTYAMQQNNGNVDKFCVWTDNETYAGKMQPVQALAQYRKKYNKNAKLIVCATSVTGFSIADPKDPGMLDIVGFDASAPALIQSF